jgi:hypothetical protein
MHVVYRIEHLPSKRWYVGVANLPMWNGGYMGSGTKWKKIIRGKPRTDFSREVIAVFENADQAFAYEEKFITQEVIDSDPLCCNLKPGGRGARKANYHVSQAEAENRSNAMKKLAARRKEAGLPGANKGKQFNPEWCKKLGDSARGTSWWVNPEGVNKRASEQPGPEWKKGRRYV